MSELMSRSLLWFLVTAFMEKQDIVTGIKEVNHVLKHKRHK